MQVNALELLSYGFTAMPYLVAVMLGLVIPIAGVLCYSNFLAGVMLIVGMYSIEALSMLVGGISLGISLYYTDFALVFIFFVALLRVLFSKNRPELNGTWVLCGLVALFSLLSGIATFGSTAGVQARPYFYFFAATLYPMTFAIDAKKLRHFFNVIAWLAVLLLCITAYRWVVYYTPIRELLPPEGNYNSDGPIRVIRSQETLILAQVLVAGVFFMQAAGAKGFLIARGLSPLLLAAVLVLQHRSVWVAAAAGVLSSLFVSRLRGGSAVGQVVLLSFIALTTALPLVVSDDLSGVSSQITNSAGAALSEKGSAGERVDSWKEIIKIWASAGPKSIALGQSFGSDTTRFVRDEAGSVRKLSYTAHNMYVQTLSNMGLIGLGSYLWVAAYVVMGLYRICASPDGTTADQVLFVFVLMQLVYYIPYGTDYFQGMIFGIALVYVMRHPVTQTYRANANTKSQRPGRWGIT
jgi:O-Antigen ligase